MRNAGFYTWRSTCHIFGFWFSHFLLYFVVTIMCLIVTLHFLSFSFSCPFFMCTCVSFVIHSSVFKPVFSPHSFFPVFPAPLWCSLFVLRDFLFLSSVLYISVGFLLDFLLPAFCCLLFGFFVELFRLVFE